MPDIDEMEAENLALAANYSEANKRIAVSSYPTAMSYAQDEGQTLDEMFIALQDRVTTAQYFLQVFAFSQAPDELDFFSSMLLTADRHSILSKCGQNWFMDLPVYLDAD